MLKKNSNLNLIANYRLFTGLTLIEILIVMLIAGVLLTVAFPGFQSMLQDKRQTQGEAILLEILQSQETYYGQHETYTLNLNDLNHNTTQESVNNKIFYAASAKPCDGQALNRCVKVVATPLTSGDPYLSITNISDQVIISSGAP